MTNKTLIEELRQHLDISHNHEAGLIPWSTRAMIEKAADALEAQEWQPIETALKDGTKIDVLLWGWGRLSDIAWEELEGFGPPYPKETWCDGFGNPCWTPMEGPQSITHWRPINAPEAPLDN
jgi:hypothetical protein